MPMHVLDEMHHFTCRIPKQAPTAINMITKHVEFIYIMAPVFSSLIDAKSRKSSQISSKWRRPRYRNIWMENQKCATCVDRKIWTNKKRRKGKKPERKKTLREERFLATCARLTCIGDQDKDCLQKNCCFADILYIYFHSVAHKLICCHYCPGGSGLS